MSKTVNKQAIAHWILGQMSDPSSVQWIRTLWDRLSPLPGGKRLFSRVLSQLIPYTGSIHPEILRLEPGYAAAQMNDRPALRNHLQSVHALALGNLAELTGNLALVYSMPENARFIVTELKTQYTKKARGTISARCSCPLVSTNERQAYSIHVELFDSAGDVVAKATLETLVGPTKLK